MRSLRCLPLVLLLAAAGCGGGEEKGSSGAAEAPPEPAALAGQWWQWAADVPEGEDPVTDKTGARCADRQPDDLTFLAGTTGGKASRTCTISADKPIFFPVLNRICPAEGDAADAARECGQGLREAETTVQVNGEDVAPEYVESERFSLDPHPDAPLRAGEAVAVGWHVLLEPLVAGEHEVRFYGREDDFELDVRYRLTVE